MHAGCGCDGPVDGLMPTWVGRPKVASPDAVCAVAYFRAMQTLKAENSKLRVLHNERHVEAAEWRDIADDLAGALRLPDTFAGGGAAGWEQTQDALARYDDRAAQ
jgi:hypothetical protein